MYTEYLQLKTANKEIFLWYIMGRKVIVNWCS